MSWLFHRWLLMYGMVLLVKDSQSLFLRHTQTGKCLTRSEKPVYPKPDHGLSYYAVMTNNCIDNKAQFRYLDSQLLHNIEKNGTLVAPTNSDYKGRWAVFKGVSKQGKKYQNDYMHRLRQGAAGSLSFYSIQDHTCAEPSSGYVLRKTCNYSRKQQEFTFGSVTNYGTKMENVHCSSTERMVVKSADYGDFNVNGIFNDDKNIDSQCSKLTNCQVKSLCDGKRSCELTIDNNLLPSAYCSDTSKQIYIRYTCVREYRPTAVKSAPNIRLSHHPNEGYLQIKDGFTWRYVREKNWDLYRVKMLCHHLGFHESDRDAVYIAHVESGSDIATGDFICYHMTQSSRTSCCVQLQPSTTNKRVEEGSLHTTCKICDNPILPNSSIIFSGSGSTNFEGARFSTLVGRGWCGTGSTPYLMLDLLKEYHITRVVTMGNRDQTKWSETYLMKYSHDETLLDDIQAMQIKGNQNGYQASTTMVDIYNVRHMKIIQSTKSKDFCLRIEVCGVVQKPAPVYDIEVTPYQYSARVTWKIRTAPEDSSYITNLIICLNSAECQTKSRRETETNFTRLEPITSYEVEIETQDGSLQKSARISKPFVTRETVENVNSKKSEFEKSNEGKVQVGLLIPLVILSSCFLLSLGVNIYQRRLIQSYNRQACHRFEASKNTKKKERFDREDSKKNGVYVCPDYGTKPEISTTQEPSIYMSLRDNREPGNPYQSLQFPNIHTVS